MASLLSFVKKAAKVVSNIPQDINHDVYQPVVRNAVQPVLRAAPVPVQGAAHAIAQNVGAVASPAYHNVMPLNPLASGINGIRTATALATHNPTALHNSFKPYVGIGQEVKGLAQGTAAQ